jgi:hypothetical protein
VTRRTGGESAKGNFFRGKFDVKLVNELDWLLQLASEKPTLNNQPSTCHWNERECASSGTTLAG